MNTNHLGLLLLPLPSVSSSANTNAVCGPAIDGTLNHIKHAFHSSYADNSNSSSNFRLDVAAAVPESWFCSHVPPRHMLFKRAQKLLAQMYSLICTSAAMQKIELDGPTGVDIRVFFLIPSSAGIETAAEAGKLSSGPFVSIEALTKARRDYGILYSIDNENGQKQQSSFLDLCKAQNQKSPICPIFPGGQLVTMDISPQLPEDDTCPENSHVSVAVGGTFDHLHIGHKLLLTATALLAQPKTSSGNPAQTVHLTIGISGDELLINKRFKEELESWNDRQQKVYEFIESILVFSAPGQVSRKTENISQPGPNGHIVRVTIDSDIVIDCVEISDPLGPTITDRNISALVLSQETRSGATVINTKRAEKGWPLLDVFEIGILEASPNDEENTDPSPISASIESKISSTEIRRRLHERRQRQTVETANN
jgi:phosphopantetheine adenylyltransferase